MVTVCQKVTDGLSNLKIWVWQLDKSEVCHPKPVWFISGTGDYETANRSIFGYLRIFAYSS